MADEFIASLNDGYSLPSLGVITNDICSSGLYVCERSSPNELAFRFAYKERRADWPEDLILTLDGGKLLLTIHSATRQERIKLIQDIEAALGRSGIIVLFKDL